ncbi:hypothetical protein P4S81_09775 [Pseudoalteromonas sp. B28]
MKIFRSEPLHLYQHHDAHFGFLDRLLVKGEQERHGFNRRMFDEDFARLFHPTSRGSSNLFEIESNDNDLMQKLLGNVNTRYYGSHTIDESIRELVEGIAQSLIWCGSSYFFLHDDTEQEKIHLASFSSYGVLSLFGTLIQWVPKRRERHWDRDDEVFSREIRILDAAKVMRFDMPIPIKRILSAQNRTLSVLDKHQFGEMNFHSQATHDTPNPTNHFDFSVWKDTQEHALYRATRRTGWNGRKYDSIKRSDFFDCHRLIRFRRNQLLLIDDILNQLSSELSKAGKSYKADFSVKISGTDELPNVAYLNELEVKLVREEVGINEIIDYCYER